jgi:hypothetical protein
MQGIHRAHNNEHNARAKFPVLESTQVRDAFKPPFIAFGDTCNKRNLNLVATVDNISRHSIVVCKDCRILWQRDVNTSKDIVHLQGGLHDNDNNNDNNISPLRMSFLFLVTMIKIFAS